MGREFFLPLTYRVRNRITSCTLLWFRTRETKGRLKVKREN